MGMDTKNVPNNALCGPTGKPIAFPADNVGYIAAMDTAELVGEYLGYEFDAARISESVFLFPGENRPRSALTIPERAIVAAFAWYCAEYSLGLKRNYTAAFPAVMVQHGGPNAAECIFRDEGTAYRFCEIAESVFTVHAEVVTAPEGWMVMISDDDALVDAELLENLRGVFSLLGYYRIERIPPAPTPEGLVFSPEARAAWRDRKSTQADRIEDGINAILARLDSGRINTLQDDSDAPTAPAKPPKRPAKKPASASARRPE